MTHLACKHCKHPAERFGPIGMWQHCPDHEGGSLLHEWVERLPPGPCPSCGQHGHAMAPESGPGPLCSPLRDVTGDFKGADFYDCNNSERLEHKDADEAIEAALEGMDADPETLTVGAYKRAVPDLADIAERVWEDALERLDELLGDPEGDPAEATPAMREAARTFAAAILSDYEQAVRALWPVHRRRGGLAQGPAIAPGAAVSGEVNIDVRSYVSAELEGRLVREADGRPVLEPGPAGNLRDRTRWVMALNRILGKGSGPMTVRVVVERPKAKRSNDQNAYLWAVVYPVLFDGLRQIALDAGEECPVRSVDHLHTIGKQTFLPVVELPGGLRDRPTTTTLSTAEFAAYVNELVRYGADRGIYIPPASHGEEA